MDDSRDLVKVLMGGAYGIYQLSTGQIIVPPAYDYIYPFQNGRAVVRKGPETWANKVFANAAAGDTRFFEIDRYGNEYFDTPGLQEEYTCIIEKGDTCPDCRGCGCASCCGLGFIPPGGYFDLD